MQQRGRTALFAKRKEGDPQVNNRMRDLQVITNIENEAQLLDLASTSSFARAGSPKGVVMVVLYMSLMGDTDALAELTERTCRAGRSSPRASACRSRRARGARGAPRRCGGSRNTGSRRRGPCPAW